MDRAPVAISLLLAAAASLAAEPPITAPATAEAVTVPRPIDPAATVDPAAPATASSGPARAAATATAETELKNDGANPRPAADASKPAVLTVDIKKVTDDTICRKERPTGSLIGITRCYPRNATLKDDDLMRRDIEEMRMRQNEQQAREAAAAMNRRRVGVQ